MHDAWIIAKTIKCFVNETVILEIIKNFNLFKFFCIFCWPPSKNTLIFFEKIRGCFHHNIYLEGGTSSNL